MQNRDLTGLLVKWGQGEPGILDQILPVVYNELLWFVRTSRELARACFRVVCQPTGSLLRPMLLQPTGSARGESVPRGSELGQRELLR